MMAALDRRARRGFQGLWLAYGFLWLSLTLRTVVWPPAGREPSVAVWLMLVLPLLLFLPGLLRRQYRSALWLCLVVLLYFLKAVSDLFVTAGWVDALQCLSAVGVFVTGLLAARWQQQALAAAYRGETSASAPPDAAASD